MARREKKPEPGAPLWMATYADLMSLLLCFFVMLFAMSIIQEVKWEAFVETQMRKMGYSGQSPRESQGNSLATSLSSVSELSRRSAAMLGSQPIQGRRGEYLRTQTIRPEGDVVKGGLIRFELGNAELTEQAKHDLESLLPVLRDSNNKIMIQGHAAPTETDLGIYSRDFFLTYARAINVKKHLLSLGLKEEFFRLGTSDSTTIPNRAILPPEVRRDPRLAGASVAVYLIDGTQRTVDH